MNKPTKPTCKLIGTDGNVFAIIGKVSKTLKSSGLNEEAKKMQDRCFSAGSYDEVLQIIQEYVEIE